MTNDIKLSDVRSNPLYGAPVACFVAGISYRQLDYWARTELVIPTEIAHGSGSHRLYGFYDILILKIVKQLIDAGIDLSKIRTIVKFIHGKQMPFLHGSTIMSDGSSVYQFVDNKEVVDFIQNAEGFFGIFIDSIIEKVEKQILLIKE